METEHATLEMEITPCMEKLFVDTFNIEVEMIQGFIRVLPDGRKHYKISICQEKAELVKKFVLMIFSKSNQINLN